MPEVVIWSVVAEQDLSNILQYLSKVWSNKIALDFIDIVENIIFQISKNPKQFPIIFKKEKIRKCVLTKHNILYYKYQNNSIYILRIYDSRQDPDKLSFV